MVDLSITDIAFVIFFVIADNYHFLLSPIIIKIFINVIAINMHKHMLYVHSVES